MCVYMLDAVIISNTIRGNWYIQCISKCYDTTPCELKNTCLSSYCTQDVVPLLFVFNCKSIGDVEPPKILSQVPSNTNVLESFRQIVCVQECMRGNEYGESRQYVNRNLYWLESSS